MAGAALDDATSGSDSRTGGRGRYDRDRFGGDEGGSGDDDFLDDSLTTRTMKIIKRKKMAEWVRRR